jgi:hypothetical protein
VRNPCKGGDRRLRNVNPKSASVKHWFYAEVQAIFQSFYEGAIDCREHTSIHKFTYARKKGRFLIKGLKAFISYFTAGDDL